MLKRHVPCQRDILLRLDAVVNCQTMGGAKIGHYSLRGLRGIIVSHDYGVSEVPLGLLVFQFGEQQPQEILSLESTDAHRNVMTYHGVVGWIWIHANRNRFFAVVRQRVRPLEYLAIEANVRLPCSATPRTGKAVRNKF